MKNVRQSREIQKLHTELKERRSLCIMAIANNTWHFEHLQLKYKTKAQWETAGANGADHVLAVGEIGLEIDTKKYKLGDGTSKWSELEYYSNPAVTALIDAVTERLTTAEGKIETLENDMSTVKSDVETAKGEIDTLKSQVNTIMGVTTLSVNPAPESDPESGGSDPENTGD